MKSDETHDNLVLALRRMLRSLMRVLIRVGIRFDEFDALVQRVYVESAIRDFAHRAPPSRERVAVLAGLTARQVNRHVDGGDPVPETDPTLRALLVEVLHRWHTIPEYGGPYGIPLELEFETPPDRCFRSLVKLASGRANPNVILEELLRTGAVARAGERRFRPLSRFLMTADPTSPRLIERFGITSSQLANTLEYNMDRERAERLLDRRVSAGRGLPLELVPAFEEYARGKAADFLLELDNWLASQSEAESGSSDAGKRIDAGVNVFFFVEPLDKTEEPLASLASKT